MKLPHRHCTPLLATAIALLALGGCGKADDRTPGQQVDATLNAVHSGAAQLKADATRGAAQAEQAGKALVQDVKIAADKAGEKISSGISDAAIATAVNVELARDGKLQPTRIDVDVARGRVALRGTAPDAESVRRARTIVLAIKGVTGVDNYLTVVKS